MEEKKLTGYPSIDKPWLKHYSEEAIHASIPECTIYEYIWNRNKECLDKPALNYFDKRITYRQMFSYIDRAAKAFSAIGVQQGELVSICMLTMPETTYTIYALNKLGAICNLIEPRTNAELIKDRINATHSRVLVVVDVFLPKIMQIVDKTQLEQIIVVPLAESMSLAYKAGFSCTKGRKIPGIPADRRFRYWNAFIKSGTDQDFISAPYQKDAPAAIIYTGGTTGIPKGALLSNDGMVTMAVHSKYTAPRLWEGNRFLGIMPPFIAYGLVFGQFIPFCAGSETVQIPVFDPKKFDELVLKYKPNHVIGVPSFFEMLADSKKVRKKKLDFLLCAITGGDKLLEGTETHINQFLADHGCKHRIMKGYGMTEIGSAATFTSADETNLPGCVGIPGHCINVKVIDPASGEELTYGQQGEICLCGKTMMLGYYDNDAETKKVMHTHPDGTTWIHSGDIGYVTEDGIVFIVDRIKRMIIRPDGHNVWPSRIEEVAMRHPAVKDCAVVGMPNPENKNGKIPTAFIVVEDSHEANDALIEDIDRFSKEQLPERDVAMAYRFIEQLPLTLVGKVDYRVLEREAENECKIMEDKDVQHFIEHKLKSFPKVEQIRSMHSIVVTPNLLADLEKAIKKNIPNDSCQIRYICKYKKKADAYFNSIQELDGCDNSLDRTIKTLVMEVSAGKDFSAELTFGKATLEDLDYAFYALSVPTPVNVLGYVKGKEKQIAKLKADIIYQIRRHSHKSLYSFFSYAGILFTVLLTVGLFAGYRYLWGIPETYSIPIMNIVDKPYNSATFWGKVMPYAKLWLSVFGFAICLGDLVRQIFPRVQFIIGDNQDAVQRKRTTKDRILWDILFAFILNLVILFIEYNI